MDNFDLRKYLAEGRLLKEEFVKGTPQYYVKYTTQDGETAKSGLMSKREAIYKERDLVDSGVKKSSVHKIQKNMDLNGKEYEIEYELDKDIEYRTDEEGKPIMENIQDENLLAKLATDILDEFRVYAESKGLKDYYNLLMKLGGTELAGDTFEDMMYKRNDFNSFKDFLNDEIVFFKQEGDVEIIDKIKSIFLNKNNLIQYLNQSMDYLKKIPSDDDVYSAIQAVADGLNPYTGEQFDFEADDIQSELERLIA